MRIYLGKHFISVLLVVIIIPCCSNLHDKKYTNSDLEYLSSAIEITGNISKLSKELTIELRKYPNMDYEHVFNKIQVLLNIIDNGRRVNRPDNFSEAYDLWKNSLDDWKEGLLLLDKGLEKHNAEFISNGSVKMISAGKSMKAATNNMKGHLKEITKYENNRK